MDLNELRQQIDAIDQVLVDLFTQRMEISARIGDDEVIALDSAECLRLGICGIGKIDSNERADRDAALVKQTAGLSDVNVFGVLRGDGFFKGGESAVEA